MNKIYRHGDLILRLVDKTEGKKIKHNGSFVLAEGEASNHKHLLTAPQMIVRQTEDGKYYLDMVKEGALSHEEHKTLIIPPGTYEVSREQETDWFANGVTRKVVD